MNLLKMRSVIKGDHVHTTFFQGKESQTLVNVGTLVQSANEWGLVGAAVILGADVMNKVAVHTHLKVVTEGDNEVVEVLHEREQKLSG